MSKDQSDFTANLWREQFITNYEGKSEEAKKLQPFLKETYKGDVYIPWAVMERLTYMQDPYADFEVVKNEENNIVHRDYYRVETYSKAEDKEIHTKADVFTHFVIVRLTFLGKTFEETYPIQDNSYEAPKVINQNMINKALQRAKAKIASRATGLGFKLYEGGDLQFNNSVKPTIKKAEKPENTTTKNPENTTTKNPENTSKADDKVMELASFVHKNEQLVETFQKLNSVVYKNYKFVFDVNESVEQIAEKLNKIKDPEVFIRTVKAKSGLEV